MDSDEAHFCAARLSYSSKRCRPSWAKSARFSTSAPSLSPHVDCRALGPLFPTSTWHESLPLKSASYCCRSRKELRALTKDSDIRLALKDTSDRSCPACKTRQLNDGLGSTGLRVPKSGCYLRCVQYRSRCIVPVLFPSVLAYTLRIRLRVMPPIDHPHVHDAAHLNTRLANADHYNILRHTKDTHAVTRLNREMKSIALLAT